MLIFIDIVAHRVLLISFFLFFSNSTYCSKTLRHQKTLLICLFMMTSSNGNIFRVTGPLCGEFTSPGEFPTQRPVTRSFDVDLRLNKRLSKQSWGWWFETLSRSLWRHRNVNSFHQPESILGFHLVMAEWITHFPAGNNHSLFHEIIKLEAIYQPPAQVLRIDQQRDSLRSIELTNPSFDKRLIELMMSMTKNT